MGGIGQHLLAMASLPPDARVLAVGYTPRQWFADVSDVSVHQGDALGDKATRECFDLVCLELEGTEAELIPLLGALRKRLSRRGMLLLIHRQVKLMRRERLRAVRRELQGLEFSEITEFLCFPDPSRPEEFALRGGAFEGTLDDSRTLLGLLNRFGRQWRHRQASIFVCRARPAREECLMQELADRQLVPDSAEGRSPVLRFDPRERGALVLFMQSVTDSAGQIVRVCPPGDDRQALIARNHTFQAEIHRNSSISQEVKSVVPLPIARFSSGSSEVFVESLKAGEIAWKVKRPSIRRKVHANSMRLIGQVESGSEISLTVGGDEAQELFPDPGSALSSGRYTPDVAAVGETLTAFVKNLRARTIGRSHVMVASHGDYGYGNILIDPVSGKITGIIDWATGKGREFGGIDRLNLEVQRRRIEGAVSLPEALDATLQAFPMMPARFTAILSMEELMAITVHRYVWRDLQHPTVAARKVRSLVAALNWANGMIGEP